MVAINVVVKLNDDEICIEVVEMNFELGTIVNGENIVKVENFIEILVNSVKVKNEIVVIPKKVGKVNLKKVKLLDMVVELKNKVTREKRNSGEETLRAVENGKIVRDGVNQAN